MSPSSIPPPVSSGRNPVTTPRSAHVHRVSVELEDVDQARAAFSKLHGDAQLEPLPGIPFHYKLNVISYGSIHLSKGEHMGGGEIIVPSITQRYILSRTVAGAVHGEHAGQDFVGVPGRGYMLFSPALPGSMHVGPGHQAENISIDRGALEAHLALLTGETRHVPIHFDVNLNVAQPRTAAIAGLAELFSQEIERPEPSLPTLAALRDALFTTLLMAANHSARECLTKPAPKVAPACVRRVEEYILAHATEPITLDELVAIAGAPARSLQVAFQKFRGTTPMGFLRQTRLDLARQRLLDARGSKSVIDVVHELGLGHPGRFSAEYKQRFGETPSETIARLARR